MARAIPFTPQIGNLPKKLGMCNLFSRALDMYMYLASFFCSFVMQVFQSKENWL